MNMICPKCGSGRVWQYHLPPGHIWCDACNQRSTIDEPIEHGPRVTIFTNADLESARAEGRKEAIEEVLTYCHKYSYDHELYEVLHAIAEGTKEQKCPT